MPPSPFDSEPTEGERPSALLRKQTQSPLEFMCSTPSTPSGVLAESSGLKWQSCSFWFHAGAQQTIREQPLTAEDPPPPPAGGLLLPATPLGQPAGLLPSSFCHAPY